MMGKSLYLRGKARDVDNMQCAVLVFKGKPA